ncbi:MAG: protein-L-isoaspartate(D-aspartate) O-methyltransferase [Terriglobia bacterium]
MTRNRKRLLAALLALGVPLCGIAAEEAAKWTRARQQMVARQLASPADRRDPVRDSRVLQAMRTIPRHAFVPSSQLPYAYDDRPLPIGLGQTISQPYIVARMSELLDVKPEHRVLEIGTGSGYQAAVLSPLAKEVYTIEIFEELATRARQRLARLGYANVSVRHADGYWGWPEAAPFDRIIVTAAPTHVPPPLIAQLKPGGKMVIPVGTVFYAQTLLLVEKGEDNRDIKTHSIMPVLFVPFLGDHNTPKN